jgi:RHS repeat-associated protein
VDIADQGAVLAAFGQNYPVLQLKWDAENRLVSHAPDNPEAGDQKVTYDYLGRRVEKQVFDWNLNDPNEGEDDGWATTPTTHRKFLWYNWLMIAELDGADDARVRTYTWGLDLGNVAQPPSAGAGPANGRSIESAGGIGGLLATRDEADAKSYVHFYDGNGNVTQMIDRSDDSTAAHYEYDAYGNQLLDLADPNQSGPYADTNAFRFSTKWWDDETGLGYWGYRYYSARNGRWFSRDPLGETGGLNLYWYAANGPVQRADPIGLDLGHSHGDPRCHWRGGETFTPRKPQNDVVLDDPVQALCHYIWGGGKQARLHIGLVSRFQEGLSFGWILEDILADAQAALPTQLGCQPFNWQDSGFKYDVLTSSAWVPHEGKWWYDTKHCGRLGYLIGTIREVSWHGQLQIKPLGMAKCNGVCTCIMEQDINIRFTITDTYNFGGDNNILLAPLRALGTPFTISNTFEWEHTSFIGETCSP